MAPPAPAGPHFPLYLLRRMPLQSLVLPSLQPIHMSLLSIVLQLRSHGNRLHCDRFPALHHFSFAFRCIPNHACPQPSQLPLAVVIDLWLPQFRSMASPATLFPGKEKKEPRKRARRRWLRAHNACCAKQPAITLRDLLLSACLPSALGWLSFFPFSFGKKLRGKGKEKLNK